MSPFWHLEFSVGFWIFGKSVYAWFIILMSEGRALDDFVPS